MAYVPPKSLQLLPEKVPAQFKARTHLEKAVTLEEPHLRYLELWKGFEALYNDKVAGAAKFLATRAGPKTPGVLDHVAAVITSLNRPRVEQLLAHPELPALMVLLSKKNLKRLIGDNEMMQEALLTQGEWQTARRDLHYNLKANYWKAATALARVLFLVRAAADPTVRKTDNLVSDAAALKGAYEILRFAMRTLVEQLSEEQQTFMEVGERTPLAVKARERKIKKV